MIHDSNIKWYKINGELKVRDGTGFYTPLFEGNISLSQLKDTDLSELEDGYILVWDSVENKWVAKEYTSSGGGGITEIPTLEQVANMGNKATTFLQAANFVHTGSTMSDVDSYYTADEVDRVVREYVNANVQQIKPATTSSLGGVIVGNTLTVASNGLLNVDLTKVVGKQNLQSVTGYGNTTTDFIKAENFVNTGSSIISTGTYYDANATDAAIEKAIAAFAPNAGVKYLAALEDVKLTAIGENQLLQYKNGMWVNIDPVFAPAKHTHEISDVNNLEETLADKANITGDSEIDFNANISYARNFVSSGNIYIPGAYWDAEQTQAAIENYVATTQGKLEPATTTKLGGVIIGNNITVDATGKISVTALAWENISNKPSSFAPSAHTHSKSEVGLGNVDNTADANKNVLSATKLTTPRTIFGQSFDGSAKVSGALSDATTGTFAGNVYSTNFVQSPNGLNETGYYSAAVIDQKLADLGTTVGKQNLADLNDVNVSSKTDGQVLTWDNTSLRWIAKNTQSILNGTGYVKMNGTSISYDNTVWHAGNFTPSSKLDTSAYTAADVLAKLKTVDGVGSGLDADRFHDKPIDHFVRGNSASAVNMFYNAEQYEAWLDSGFGWRQYDTSDIYGTDYGDGIIKVAFADKNYDARLIFSYNQNKIKFQWRMSGHLSDIKELFHNQNANVNTVDWTARNLVNKGYAWLQIGDAATPNTGALKGANTFSLLSGNNAYGVHHGINGTGNAWIQVGRNDGTPTLYDLLLQPSGGKVVIGNKLTIAPHIAGVDIISSGNIAPHYQTSFAWYTGYAGSGTQRMLLDASGNLSVTGTVIANRFMGKADAADRLDALPNYIWDGNTPIWDYSMGLQLSFVQGANAFPSYGSVLTAKTYHGGGGSFQLYMGYGHVHGGNYMRYRNVDYDAGTVWTGWKTLWDSGNSNNSTSDWVARNLTLAGSITGATTINATGDLTITGFEYKKITLMQSHINTVNTKILSTRYTWYNTGYWDLGVMRGDSQDISSFILDYSANGSSETRMLTMTTAGDTSIQGSFGINNTSSTTQKGISLYGGAAAGLPIYGLAFTGTAALGQHGDTNDSWSTYFTMGAGSNRRGWIFKSSGNGNVASISDRGIVAAANYIQTPAGINTTSYYTAAQIDGMIGGAVGKQTLSELNDTTITTPTSGQVLSYNGTKWVNSNAFTLPTASSSILGGVKVGNSLNISNGVLDIKSGSGSGLDADLLDGLHASDFAKQTEAVTKRRNLVSNENADTILDSGVYLLAVGDGTGNSNFPTPYGVFLVHATDAFASQTIIVHETAEIYTRILYTYGGNWSAWNRAWTSRNANRSDADWYTKTLYAAQGANITGHASLQGLSANGIELRGAYGVGKLLHTIGHDESNMQFHYYDDNQNWAGISMTIERSTGSVYMHKWIQTRNSNVGIKIGDDVQLADRDAGNTLFVEGQQNNDRGYINFGSTRGNSLGAINGGELTWKDNKVFHAGNDGAGSGLDADTVDGYHADDLFRAKLGSPANLNDAYIEGSYHWTPSTLNRPGDSYGSLLSINGYAYNDGRGWNNQLAFGTDGGFYKRKSINNNTSWSSWATIWTSDNATITATTFTGALNGNANTATQLLNAKTIWGQGFNGTANVSGAMYGWTGSRIGNTTTQASAALPMTETSYNISSVNSPNITFPYANNANALLTIRSHFGDYYHQIGFSSNGSLYTRALMAHDNDGHAWNQILDTSNDTVFRERGDVLQGNLDTFSFRPSGTYNILYSGFTKQLTSFRRPSGSASALEFVNDFGGNEFLFRSGRDGSSFSPWRTVYHSGNTNKSDVDWSADTLTANKVVSSILSLKNASDNYHKLIYDSATDREKLYSSVGFDVVSGNGTMLSMNAAGDLNVYRKVKITAPFGNAWSANIEGAFNIDIPNDGNQTPILTARKSGVRAFSIEVLNGGDAYRVVGGSNYMEMTSTYTKFTTTIQGTNFIQTPTANNGDGYYTAAQVETRLTQVGGGGAKVFVIKLRADGTNVTPTGWSASKTGTGAWTITAKAGDLASDSYGVFFMAGDPGGNSGSTDNGFGTIVLKTTSSIQIKTKNPSGTDTDLRGTLTIII